MIDQAHRLRQAMRNTPGTPPRKKELSPGHPQDGGSGRLRAISVSSGKGGVGKTNIALMLCMALASLKKKVLLFDGDLGLANVHILLGLAPKRNLSHVLSEECTIEDAICKGPMGIDILPGASGMERLANAEPLQLEILKRNLVPLQARYDFLVVDTSAGIGTVSSTFASLADSCLCVMTPEPTSLADVYAMIKVLHERGARSIEVLVNMSRNDNEGIEAFERLARLCKKFLHRKVGCAGILPFERDIQSLVRQQKVLLVEKPRAAFSVRLTACARNICGIPAVSNVGFFSRVFAGLGGLNIQTRR